MRKIKMTVFERLADGAVRTESLRLARNMVKEELKRQGIKISDVEASNITKVAIRLLKTDSDIIKKARRNLYKQHLARLKLEDE